MFSIPSEFAYLFLTIPFLIVWGILYWVGKETRREQLTFSLVGVVIGPVSEIFYFKDYWMPKSIFLMKIGNFLLLPEDILFGFAICGIGGVIFEVVFRRRLRKLSPIAKRTIHISALGFLFAFSFLACLWLGLNSIYASAIAFVITALPIMFARHDLLMDAMGSGLGVMFIMFMCYFIGFNLVSNSQDLLREQWFLYGTNLDTRIWGIPLTEMVWGFTWGFLFGPFYEFWVNKKLVSTSRVP